jgi:ribosomal protein L11 methyltransferase
VLAALLELAPAGVEQVDGDGFVEYAVYGAPGELAAFPDGAAEVGGVRVAVRGEEVADDWGERWKRFHQPQLVAGRIWLRPPWAAPRAGAVDVVVDPGQAFGTGSHPTTRLSLELLLATEAAGSLADLGCGSGVLTIVAAKVGFGPVTAVDHDPAALEATRENARVNGVELAAVERRDLRRTPAPRAQTMAANLMRPLLLRVAELMEERPQTLVVSGLLEQEADEVAAAFEPLLERRRLSSLGWSALLLSVP